MSIIPDNIFPCSNNDIFVTGGHRCISILLVTCISHLLVLKAFSFSFLSNERIRMIVLSTALYSSEMCNSALRHKCRIPCQLFAFH